MLIRSVAVIGIGAMGAPMARRLQAAAGRRLGLLVQRVSEDRAGGAAEKQHGEPGPHQRRQDDRRAQRTS